jgi:hypothetical protein
MSDRLQLWILLLVSLLVWIAYALHTGMQLEDALITYKYAENLVAGNGLVYNVGERVLGTTTMLFTLLLAAGGYVFGIGAIPAVALVISLAAMVATGFLSYQILRSFECPHYTSLLGVASVLIGPHMVWAYCGRMETALVIFLMAASLYALIRKRFALSGTLAALLVTTRPDGLVWAVLLCVAVFFTDRRGALRFIIPALIIGVIYVGATTIFYCTPIPQSIIAKAVIGKDDTLAWTIRWWVSMFSIAPASSWIALPFALLGVWTIAKLRKLTPAKLLFLAFPFAYIGLFILTRAPLHAWYAIPARWAITLIAVAGTAMFIAPRVRAKKWRMSFAITLSAVWLGAQLFTLLREAETDRMRQANEDGTRRKVGEWINAHALPNDRVALEPIGYAGYYSKRKVIDMAGLISPEIVEIRKRSQTNAEAFQRMIDALRPEFIVLRSMEVDSNQHFHGGKLFLTTEDSVQFRAMHEEVYRVKAPYPQVWSVDSTFTIFRRK